MSGARPPGAPPAPLPANVRALGAVSLLTDVSSEMIYPLLPGFLTGMLGAGAAALGAIEGAAEATASLLKFLSGRTSDRTRRRKPLVVAGYLLATVARPLVAAAGTAAHVLAVRLTDRVGKGIRTSPRDALLADSVAPSERGRAFGFHRAADHAGAVLGPLVAWAMMALFGCSVRTVFWCAAVPGVLSVLVLVLFVREVPAAPAQETPRVAAPASGSAAAAPEAFGAGFRAYLAVLFLFTLGNCTDAFLLLRASELGTPAAALPLLWAGLHVVKAVSSTPAGALSDRIGRRPLLVAGWAWFAAIYLGLGAATETWHVVTLFVGYGLFFGLTEGTEKALVADFAPASRRGTAFGWFHMVVGLGTLPASALFGVIWDRAGSGAAFATGAGLAIAASAALLAFVPRPAR